MSEKDPKYTGKISEAELKALKEKHRTIYILEVPANDEGTEIAMGYLKPIDRQLMGALLAQNDEIVQREMMLNNLWLTGDDRIKKDDEMFFAAARMLPKVMMVRKAQLKKN